MKDLRKLRMPTVPTRVVMVLSVCSLLGSSCSAQASAIESIIAKPEMGFFVTSKGINEGSAKLGGLTGADAHCQSLAETAGTGDRRWRAYLSTSPRAGLPGVDARDRVGEGPWYNAKGVLIASDLEQLHSARNRIDRYTALSETGAPIAGRQHDILTGSNDDGRLAHVYGGPATCANWTSDQDGHAMMGHHDRFLGPGKRFAHWSRSWVASHPSRGCDAERVKRTGSAGLFYCFASDGDAASRIEPQPINEFPSFKRGLNIAHWLSHNFLPDAPYAADWFDQEDVAWIAAQGFDHLRLRVAGDRLINANGDIDEAGIKPIDDALGWARKHGLGVVLTMFSLPGYFNGVIGEPTPADRSSPFTDVDTLYDAEYVWWQVARRYADTDAELRFELLHRPQAPDAASMQRFNERMLAAIRASNPTRVVYVTSRGMDVDSLSEVMSSDSVASDWNVALAFEFKEPEAFTSQYEKTRPLVQFPGKVPDMSGSVPADDPIRRSFGAELNAATLESRLSHFAEQIKQVAWGREIYLAEYGVFQRADDPSAQNYITTLRSAFDRHGWSWAVYDYNSGCAVRDDNGQPTRILKALALQPAAIRAQ